jgi:RNA polymerase sigma-70 factor (ECF subfamily)
MNSARFERLLRQHKDAVYRQMVRVCSHREDAEDALAQAMMLAFRAADKLESESAFRSWIGTIGKRVCTRMRSHPKVLQALEFAEERDLIADAVPEMELAVMKGCVRDALDGLPAIYRDVYRLVELEERTVPEVAEQLGISTAAAKSRLLRAREIMRDRLDGSLCGR